MPLDRTATWQRAIVVERFAYDGLFPPTSYISLRFFRVPLFFFFFSSSSLTHFDVGVARNLCLHPAFGWLIAAEPSADLSHFTKCSGTCQWPDTEHAVRER